MPSNICICGCKRKDHLKPVHLDNLDIDLDVCIDPSHHCKKFKLKTKEEK